MRRTRIAMTAAAGALAIPASADALPLDRARAAAFNRALAVSLTDQFLLIRTHTDIARPRCRRTSRRRVACRYWFGVMAPQTGQTLYMETGRVVIKPDAVRVFPAPVAVARR